MRNRLAAHAASTVLYTTPTVSTSYNRAPSIERLLTFWPRYLSTYRTRRYVNTRRRHLAVSDSHEKGRVRNSTDPYEHVGSRPRCALESELQLPSTGVDVNQTKRSWLAQDTTRHYDSSHQEVFLEQERSEAPPEPPGGWFVEEDELGETSRREPAAAVSISQNTDDATFEEAQEGGSRSSPSGPVKQWALRFYSGDHELPTTSTFETIRLALQASLDHRRRSTPVNHVPENDYFKSQAAGLFDVISPALQCEWVENLIACPPSNVRAFEEWKSQISSRPDLWTWSERHQPTNVATHNFQTLTFYRGCEMLISQFHPRLSRRATLNKTVDTASHHAESSAHVRSVAGYLDRLHKNGQTGSHHEQGAVADPRASTWVASLLETQFGPTSNTSSRAVTHDAGPPLDDANLILRRAWSSLHVGLRTFLWPHILLNVIQYHPEKAIALYRVMQQRQISNHSEQGGTANDMLSIPRSTFLHTLLVRVVYGAYRPSHRFRTELFEFLREDLDPFRKQGSISNRGRLNTVMRCVISLGDDRMIGSLWNELRSRPAQSDSGSSQDLHEQPLRSTREHTIARSRTKSNKRLRPQSSTALTSFTMLHIAYRLAMARKPLEAMDAIRCTVNTGLPSTDARLSSVVNVILRQLVATENGYAASVPITTQLCEIGIPINRNLANVLILNAVNENHPETAIDLYYAGLRGGMQPDGYTFDFTLRALRKLTIDREQTENIIRQAVQYAVENQDLFVANAVLRCAYNIARADVRHEINNDFLDTASDIAQGRQIWDIICELYAKLFFIYPMEELGIWPVDSWFDGTDDGRDSSFVTISDEASWEGRTQSRRLGDAKSYYEGFLVPNAATITIMLQIRLLCMEQPPLSMVKDIFRRFWRLARAGSLPTLGGHSQRPLNDEIRIPELARAAESQHVWNMFIVAAGKSPRAPTQENAAVAFALSIFRKMVQGGDLALPEPSIWTFDSLLLACNRHHAVAASEMLQEVMESRGLRKSQITWNAIIDRYSLLQDTQRAATAVSFMEAEGHEVDMFTLRALRNFVGKSRQKFRDTIQESPPMSGRLASDEITGSSSDNFLTTRPAQRLSLDQLPTNYTKGSFGGTSLGYVTEPGPKFFSSASSVILGRNKRLVQNQQGFRRMPKVANGKLRHQKKPNETSAHISPTSQDDVVASEIVGTTIVAQRMAGSGKKISMAAAHQAGRPSVSTSDISQSRLAQLSPQLPIGV